MIANQAKLWHQFILITYAFLNIIDDYKEKAHACHSIGRAITEAVKRLLTRRS